MGIDLNGNGGTLSFQWRTWHQLLKLAESHGWEPIGTRAGANLLQRPLGMAGRAAPAQRAAIQSEGDRNDLGYFSNDHQIVLAQDAANLADALSKALECPLEYWAWQEVLATDSDDQWRVPVVPTEHNDDSDSWLVPPAGVVWEPVDPQTRGNLMNIVSDFIKYCRAGQFCIA